MKRAIGATVTAMLFLGACASGGQQSQTTPTATAIAIGTGSGCAPDHRQDLTFSGALTGHLVCAEGEPVCKFVAVGSGESVFAAVIHGVAGGKPLLVSFAVDGFNGPGSYASDNREGGTSVTVDGPVHWQGHLGDAVIVSTAGSQILTGRVDSTLDDGATPSVHLTGAWVCDKIKAPG
jgi:hypothetical protein